MKIDQTTVSCLLFSKYAQRRMTKNITGIKVKRFSMVRLLALLPDRLVYRLRKTDASSSKNIIKRARRVDSKEYNETPLRNVHFFLTKINGVVGEFAKANNINWTQNELTRDNVVVTVFIIRN